MDTKSKASGIEGLGDLSLGTHFCLFYETEQDLIEPLALYLNAGLANKEFCLWITPESSEKARNALRQAIPSADQHLEAGRIEILSCQQWYCENDEFDAARVLHAFDTKLTQALEKGYGRMRVIADEAWLDQEQWKAFSDYEGKIDERFAGKPISILCAYPTASHNAADILDVAQTHHFIAAKRNGNWEILESPELKRAKAESERVSAESEAQLVEQEKFDPLRGEPAVVLNYGITVLTVIVATLILHWMNAVLQNASHVSLYLAVVIFGAWLGGFGPGLLAMALSSLAFDYYFLAPINSLALAPSALPRLLIFNLVAVFVTWLTATRRRATESLRQTSHDLKRSNQLLQAKIIELERSEEAVQVSRARLQAAIDAADIVLWERDLSSGHITWLGHHEKLLGFAAGELDDNTLASFENRIHPEDIEGLRRIRQRALEERSEYSHEYRVVWRDGSIHWIRAQGRFIYNEAGQPVRLYGAVLDITERKQAEAERQKNKEILQKIFDNVPVMITMVDKDGQFILINRDFESRLGWRQDELTERPQDLLADLYPDQRARQAVLDFVERADGRWEDFRTMAKDGRLIDTSWAIVRLSDGSIIGVGKDITERKRAEEALRKSERVLREAESLGHTGSWEQDLVTGEIFNTEENLRLFFGDDRSKGANLEDYAQVVHPDDREYVLQRRAELLEAEGPGDIEYRVVWPDGSVHVIFGRATVVRSETGQPIRVYGTNVDITERKRTENALRESEKLLQLVLDTLPVGVAVTDRGGDIILANAASKRIWGNMIMSGSDRRAQSIGFWHDSGKRIAPEEWASARALTKGKTSLNELIDIETFDGAQKIMQNSAAPIRNSDGVIVGAVIVNEDVTEGVRAQEAIRKSERILREAEELGHTGSWEQDLVTGETFNSEANLRLFFGEDRSKGESFDDFVQAMHPDDREYVLQRRAQLIAEGQPGETEFRVVWPDGGIHVIHRRATIVHDESGKAIRLYGTNVDITERKRAEEEIRRYTARMEALAEISRTFAEAGLDYQSVLNTIARRTAELIGDACVMTLFSQDNQRAYPVAFHHPNPESQALMRDALLHTWQGGTDTERFHNLLAGESLYVAVVDQESYRAATEPEFWPFVDQVGISSVLIVPLQVRGRVIGTLGLTRDRHGSPYTPNDRVLLQDIADRAALTIQDAKLFEQVEGARERLEALSRRLLEVQEAERRALTAELHDRVGQNLTGLSINLQNLKASLSQEAAQELAPKFDDAQALVEDTSRQIRGIMAELHLPELEDYGLAAALETYAERAASRGNLELTADLPDLDPPRLPSDIRATLFRAAQEAISNVLKHANATGLEVSLQGGNGRVRLKVEDNGQGFEADLVSQKEGQTWGLQIMRERIESIGGKVQIESKPGQGTRVVFELERPS